MEQVRASAIGSNEYLKFEEVISDESSTKMRSWKKRYLGFRRISRLDFLSEDAWI